jgi:hypothetical protein
MDARSVVLPDCGCSARDCQSPTARSSSKLLSASPCVEDAGLSAERVAPGDQSGEFGGFVEGCLGTQRLAA